LLSRDAAYAVRSLVTVAPVTTRVRDIPSEVPLGPEDGLPRRCVVNLDSITTVPKDCLASRVTTLRVAKQVAVNAAIKFALALP
jgi:mRNA interferase MazF